ncbi:hypothetical protein [Streptomyces sp. NPDC092307]|uniref:hypothetical protein n=1 Tax=Streptomyces sp. NPDC092307 TaxID=3366013 RepID=UPI00381DBD88
MNTTSEQILIQLGRGSEVLKGTEKMGQEYLDRIIRETLRSVSGSEAAKSVDLEGLWSAMALPDRGIGGNPQFGTGSGGDITLPKVTTRQIAVGDPQRSNPRVWGAKGAVATYAPKDMPKEVEQALRGPGVRREIEERLLTDTDRLFADPEFRHRELKFSRDRLMGMAADILAEEVYSGDVQKALAQLLVRHRKPELVKLESNVVPGVVAVPTGGDAQEMLLLSVQTGQHLRWTTNSKPADYESFIRRHLSDFDNDALTSDHFRRQRVRLPNSVGFRFIHGLSFMKSDTIHKDLLDVAKVRLRSNFDSKVYTEAEHMNERDSLLGSDAMMMMGIISAPATVGAGTFATVPSFSLGIGLGAGEVYFQRKIAENADRGDVYQQAMFEAKLGMLLTAIPAALDAGALGRLGTKAAISKGIPHAIKYIKNVQKTAQRMRAAEVAVEGAASAKYGRALFARKPVCWDAVITLQESSGILTNKQAKALRGATRGTTFQDYLDGAGKEMRNFEDLRDLPPGFRVAFVVDDGGKPQMIHAMLSTGKGHMAGVNNAGLMRSLSPGLADFDMLNGRILKWSENGFLSERGPVRILVESSVEIPGRTVDGGLRQVASGILPDTDTPGLPVRTHQPAPRPGPDETGVITGKVQGSGSGQKLDAPAPQAPEPKLTQDVAQSPGRVEAPGESPDLAPREADFIPPSQGKGDSRLPTSDETGVITGKVKGNGAGQPNYAPPVGSPAQAAAGMAPASRTAWTANWGQALDDLKTGRGILDSGAINPKSGKVEGGNAAVQKWLNQAGGADAISNRKSMFDNARDDLISALKDVNENIQTIDERFTALKRAVPLDRPIPSGADPKDFVNLPTDIQTKMPEYITARRLYEQGFDTVKPGPLAKGKGVQSPDYGFTGSEDVGDHVRLLGGSAIDFESQLGKDIAGKVRAYPAAQQVHVMVDASGFKGTGLNLEGLSAQVKKVVNELPANVKSRLGNVTVVPPGNPGSRVIVVDKNGTVLNPSDPVS